MKAMFGVVSLLVALAIVGLVMVKQLKAVGHAGSASPATSEGVAVPSMSGSGTVREQAVQLQNKVADDVARAMQQGATANKEAADK
jgi:hypothetical protein